MRTGIALMYAAAGALVTSSAFATSTDLFKHKANNGTSWFSNTNITSAGSCDSSGPLSDSSANSCNVYDVIFYGWFTDLHAVYGRVNTTDSRGLVSWSGSGYPAWSYWDLYYTSSPSWDGDCNDYCWTSSGVQYCRGYVDLQDTSGEAVDEGYHTLDDPFIKIRYSYGGSTYKYTRILNHAIAPI